MSILQDAKERILILEGDIDDVIAYGIVEKMILFNNMDSEKDIYILINSIGGKTTSSMAIYDTIRWCKCPVSTISVGYTGGIASLLLAAGTKGKRYIKSDIMLTPSLLPSANKDGIYNNYHAEKLNSTIDKIIEVYAEETKNSLEVMKTVALNMHTLNANEAVNKGYVDYIFEASKTSWLKKILSNIFPQSKDKMYLDIIINLKKNGIIES